MKTLLFIASFLLFSCSNSVDAQEFVTHEKDLIYDAATMENLGRIVDSLNLKFKQCDLPHAYYSFVQGSATVFRLDMHAKEARRAIHDNISPQEFHQRFPRATMHTNVFLMRYVDEDYKGTMKIHYSSFPTQDEERFGITLPNRGEYLKSTGWVMSEGDDLLTAFYLDDMKAKEIPDQYARLIQYVDCMVDPDAKVFLDDASRSVRNFGSVDDNLKAVAFIAFAHEFIPEPTAPEFDYNADLSEAEQRKQEAAYMKYMADYREWDSLRILDLDRRMMHSQDKLTLLKEACDDALKSHDSNDEFEMYVARYYSKEKALELKRNRRVIGGCSMDRSPRYHAMNICVLAAQTAKWDIFLRSHLDIMNDRFSRMSDGSYAMAGRKTYLRELEELDINAADLLIGTCLRTDNVSDNHYFGDVSRIGRALSETSQPEKVEQQLIAMISDPALDVFNRLLMAYVYDHYSYNLTDDSKKAINRNKLLEAAKTLPVKVSLGE